MIGNGHNFHKRPWPDAAMARLRAEWATNTQTATDFDRRMGRELGHDPSAVARRRQRMGLIGTQHPRKPLPPPEKPWNTHADIVLDAAWDKRRHRSVEAFDNAYAEEYGRTAKSVRARRLERGLKSAPISDADPMIAINKANAKASARLRDAILEHHPEQVRMMRPAMLAEVNARILARVAVQMGEQG